MSFRLRWSEPWSPWKVGKLLCTGTWVPPPPVHGGWGGGVNLIWERGCCSEPAPCALWRVPGGRERVHQPFWEPCEGQPKAPLWGAECKPVMGLQISGQSLWYLKCRFLSKSVSLMQPACHPCLGFGEVLVKNSSYIFFKAGTEHPKVLVHTRPIYA